MKAIPKQLLIHEITLKTAEKDRWGKEILKEGQAVTRVRVEPSSKIIRDKNNAEIQLCAVLIYDCKNSRPKGLVFREDDLVFFNGQKHKIQTVEPLYDEKKLHHYEMGLIRNA